MTDRAPYGADAAAPLTPVVRHGLTDHVIDQLRLRIADGTWPLRHRLPVESALAKELGVGRSTIREAVRVLVHSGLLEVRQGHGTFVRSRRETDAALQRMVTQADLIEAYQVRRALEVEAARLAAQRRSAADMLGLRRLAQRRSDTYLSNSTEYAKADIALHELIVQSAGSALLVDLYRGLVVPLRGVVGPSFDDAGLVHSGAGEAALTDLLDAIDGRDAERAAAAAQRGMDEALRVLTLLLQAVVVGR